ncbi:hypothetical protein HK102_004975 [Quaeritorhiza haematococci]|nr:hypothetical protein HK102_004975 [Quaeritorhiza haematococci]
MARAIHLLLALLAVIGAVCASPSPKIEDIHKTSLELYAAGKLNEHGRFAVSVKRVDDLVDVAEDGTKTELAERITDVIVMFDVDKKGQVTVNDVPVQMGVSNLKIKAAMVVGVTKAGLETLNITSKADIENAFDVGIVGIEVDATGEQVQVNGATVTRITLKERILEINGVEVEQKDAMQQILEIALDGSVKKSMPMPCGPAAGMRMGMHHGMHHSSAHPAPAKAFHASSDAATPNDQAPHKPRIIGCFRAAKANASRWFHAQSMPTKVALSMFAGALLGCVALLIVRFVALITGAGSFGSRRRSDEEGEYDDDESGKFIKKVSFVGDEKAAYAIVLEQHRVSEEDSFLPAYNSSGYAPVASDEVARSS